MLQKTYTEDYLTGKRKVNYGQRQRYYVTANHEGIISPEVFHQVQDEMFRRARVVLNEEREQIRITKRVTEALITPVLYDVILFVTKDNTMKSHNTEYLKAIQDSVHPSKMVIAVTHFDSATIYDADEDPTLVDVRQAVAETRSSTLKLIRTVIDSDCRARLPEKDDIVCFANKRLSRLGDGTAEYFRINDSYSLMRKVMADAYKRVHRRLTNHNILPGQRQTFMVAPFAFNTTEICTLQKKLASLIQQECGSLRDMSSTYHHWTIDAVLWNFFNEREHVSNAYKWEKVGFLWGGTLIEKFQSLTKEYIQKLLRKTYFLQN